MATKKTTKKKLPNQFRFMDEGKIRLLRNCMQLYLNTQQTAYNSARNFSVGPDSRLSALFGLNDARTIFYELTEALKVFSTRRRKEEEKVWRAQVKAREQKKAEKKLARFKALAAKSR